MEFPAAVKTRLYAEIRHNIARARMDPNPTQGEFPIAKNKPLNRVQPTPLQNLDLDALKRQLKDCNRKSKT